MLRHPMATDEGGMHKLGHEFPELHTAAAAASPPTSSSSHSAAIHTPPAAMSDADQQPPSAGLMAGAGALHNNNSITICQPFGAGGLEMHDELGHYAADASNTSDFLSSTFSLLTSDSVAADSAHDQWAAYSDEQQSVKADFFGHDASGYYSHDQKVSSRSYGAPPSYSQMPHDGEMSGHVQTIPQPPSRSASETAEPAEKRMKKNNGSGANAAPQTARNSQVEYTENFKRFINIPASTPATIRFVGRFGPPSVPHCNRFISHYRANVRRHINSCKKGHSRKESTASAVEAVGSGGSNASMASYDVTSTPDDQPCSSGGMKKELQLEYHPAAHHPNAADARRPVRPLPAGRTPRFTCTRRTGCTATYRRPK
ncbi:hypothetical protein M3Y99_01333100 [Aphelenchoides fujianensis]|nr:hypothetical protein M3Y99_01333100 [Aphelenchoides fujianensis]